MNVLKTKKQNFEEWTALLNEERAIGWLVNDAVEGKEKPNILYRLDCQAYGEVTYSTIGTSILFSPKRQLLESSKLKYEYVTVRTNSFENSSFSAFKSHLTSLENEFKRIHKGAILEKICVSINVLRDDWAYGVLLYGK